MTAEEKEKILARIDQLEIVCRELETRVDKLENGNFGTGVYLDGCSENDAEYIIGKPIKKEGE